MILAILLMRYNYYDITLTNGFYEISGGNDINLGYTKDSLLITSICVLIWSILSKALCLCGIRLMKKWLFVLVSSIYLKKGISYISKLSSIFIKRKIHPNINNLTFFQFIISEIIALMVECIILIFAGLLMRAVCIFFSVQISSNILMFKAYIFHDKVFLFLNT